MKQSAQTLAKQIIPKKELLRVLSKGMITIPKAWRDELGFKKGKRILAQKRAFQIILQPLEQAAPYRIYTQKEIEQFIKSDTLPAGLRAKVKKKFSLNV